MGYDAVKNNLISIMTKLEYKESDTPNDFKNVSSLKLSNVFTINAIEGRLEETEGETLCDRFYDKQLWEIKIAFSKSEYNDIINRDNMHRKRVEIITALDKPANWIDVVRKQKYSGWKIEELDNYFLLTIDVQIIDTIIY